MTKREKIERLIRQAGHEPHDVIWGVVLIIIGIICFLVAVLGGVWALLFIGALSFACGMASLFLSESINDT